jgi:hypothetical protein
MRLNNKKADSRMLSPWLFVILGLICVAIVAGVLSYFSGTMDIRAYEAKSLSDRLVYGISEDGFLREGVIGGGFNIFESSKINEKSLENTGVFYFNISVFDDEGVLVKSFSKGNGDFEIQCRLNGNNFAKCYYREFSVLGKDNFNRYKITILTGSNNGGKSLNNAK